MTLGIVHPQGGRSIPLRHLLHHVLIHVGGRGGPVHPTRVDIETGGQEKYGQEEGGAGSGDECDEEFGCGVVVGAGAFATGFTVFVCVGLEGEVAVVTFHHDDDEYLAQRGFIR